MSKVFHCSECKLYWYYIEKDLIEVRLYVFAPIIPKNCPFCEGINKKPPTKRFLDLQRVAKNEMDILDYNNKWEVFENE